MESLDQAVKEFVAGEELITKLAEMLNVYKQVREFRVVAGTARAIMKHMIRHQGTVSPLVDRRRYQLTPYVYQFLCSQEAQSSQYHIQFLHHDATVGSVWLVYRVSAEPSAPESERPYLADLGLPGTGAIRMATVRRP